MLESELVDETDYKEIMARRIDFQNRLRRKMLESGLSEIDLEVDMLIKDIGNVFLISDSEFDPDKPISNHEEKILTLTKVDLGEETFAELADVVLSNHEESEMTVDETEGLQEWREEYDFHINNPPEEGVTIKALEGSVKLVVELKTGAPPFIYGRVYVPETVGETLGWFLQSGDSQNFHGWKCILLPRARTELIRKFGIQSETMSVKSLRFVRYSKSHKSLLCEVHEYCDEVKDTSDEIESKLPDPENRPEPTPIELDAVAPAYMDEPQNEVEQSVNEEAVKEL